VQPETIHPLALRQQLREEAIIVEIAPGTVISRRGFLNSSGNFKKRLGLVGSRGHDVSGVTLAIAAAMRPARIRLS